MSTSEQPRLAVQRAFVVKKPTRALLHPLWTADGWTVCRTERPAARCTCGAIVLDWLPLPEEKPR